MQPREALEEEPADEQEPRRRCTGECQTPARDSIMHGVMQMKLRHRAECEAQDRCPVRRDFVPKTPCVDGFAGEYPCKDVDMLAMIPLADMGSRAASDVWGWTDSTTGREYALVGLYEGSAFVDVTDPEHPEVVGLMSSHHRTIIWHDLKVYKDHAFVVSEAPEHGMQVFDLSRLRDRGRGDSVVVAGTLRLRAAAAAPSAAKAPGGEEAEDLCLESSAPPAPAPAAKGSSGGDRFLGAAVGHVVPGGGVYLKRCTKHRGAQQWRYEERTGQLQDGHGLCAEFSSGGGGGMEVHMQPCNASSASQRWRYDAQAGSLRGPLGLCLGAPPGSQKEGGRAFQAGCSDSAGAQVWELGVKALPVYEPVAVYKEVGSSHNVAINEETGMAYILGSHTCKGGLHMVNISSPAQPEFVGCFSEDGYTHDSQCVVYEGPDDRYTGAEICFNYNEDSLTIVDVSKKHAPKMLSRVGYDNSRYTHQGWLDKNSEFLFLNDELDELGYHASNPDGPSNRTRTMIWDVRNLQDAKMVGSFYSKETSIDHNLYVDGDVVFETNYCAGLRVLETSSSSGEGGKGAELKEVGFFDVSPECSIVEFSGSWSNYPYYKSGIVVVSSMERGLFILRPKLTDRTDLRESRLEAHRKRVAKGLSG